MLEYQIDDCQEPGSHEQYSGGTAASGVVSNISMIIPSRGLTVGLNTFCFNKSIVNFWFDCWFVTKLLALKEERKQNKKTER